MIEGYFPATLTLRIESEGMRDSETLELGAGMDQMITLKTKRGSIVFDPDTKEIENLGRLMKRLAEMRKEIEDLWGECYETEGQGEAK